MKDFLLFVSGPLPGAELTATYDGWLVALSYVVAALASYTAIDLANRVREFRAEPRKAAAWLAGGAVAMGGGIWSMHFVAMLAYQLPVPVRYELWTTAASMAAAVVTSGFALFIVTHSTLSARRLALSGVLMGAGIGVMHYIGMSSMRLDALVMYYAGPFALSVVNAIACSTAALWLVARRAEADTRSRVLAAAVMGIAVAGMHYTGMYATVCVSTGKDAVTVTGVDPGLLAVAIAVITLLIMGMALVVSLQSQLLSRTLRDQNLLLKREIERKQQVEAELQNHRDNLQALIDERTRDLSRANVEMRESERRFRATFDQAAVGIAHTSLDGNYLLVNRKFCEMLGYTEPELIGKSAANQSHPEDRGSFGQPRQQMLSGQYDSVSEHKRYVRKDGSLLWTQRTVSLARDESGEPLYFIRVIEDVTQQKLMMQRREMEHAVTSVLAEADLAEEAMPKLIRTMCEATGWSYGAHWTWAEAEKTLVRRACWSNFPMHVDGEENVRWRRLTLRNAKGLVSRPWFEGKPAWIADMRLEVSFNRRDAALRHGLHSAFSFPVTANGNVIGVMEFFGCEVRQPDEMLLQAAGSIGRQIGQFIQRKLAEQALHSAHADLEARVRDRTLDLEQLNATLRSEIEQKRRAEAELQLHRNNLQTLIDERTTELEHSNQVLEQRTAEVLRVTKMSNLLQTASDMREASEILSRMMGQLVAPHAGAIYLTAASLNRLECLTSWGDTQYAITISPDECWGLRRSGIYAANNPEQDMYCTHVHADARHLPYLCVPMMAHGVSLGLLHVGFVCVDEHEEVSDDERLRVQRLADQVTLALANVKLRQSLREQSIRDLLTGLYNRRYLEESLEREVARTWRDKKPLAVIMLDVDHFKRFNDQYGHEGGDAVLQALGRMLRETARASDIVARYGGEEFTVLLHNATLAGAREWGERLRENVRQMEVKAGGRTLPPITISLGLAMYGENGMATDELLRAADAALYEAKGNGRDCLVVATSIVEKAAPAMPGTPVLPPAMAMQNAATG